MYTPKELADRFREVILDGTWIANSNFKKELENLYWLHAIDVKQNINSIATIAQHIHYYITGINRVFATGNLDISDKFSFDFPAIESEKQWKGFLNKFWNDAEEFALWIEKLTPDRLDEHFVDEKYGTYLRNIDAMIEHSYYHLGQIVLIKKLLKVSF